LRFAEENGRFEKIVWRGKFYHEKNERRRNTRKAQRVKTLSAAGWRWGLKRGVNERGKAFDGNILEAIS
jgi:hypothetical protein